MSTAPWDSHEVTSSVRCTIESSSDAILLADFVKKLVKAKDSSLRVVLQPVHAPTDILVFRALRTRPNSAWVGDGVASALLPDNRVRLTGRHRRCLHPGPGRPER